MPAPTPAVERCRSAVSWRAAGPPPARRRCSGSASGPCATGWRATAPRVRPVGSADQRVTVSRRGPNAAPAGSRSRSASTTTPAPPRSRCRRTRPATARLLPGPCHGRGRRPGPHRPAGDDRPSRPQRSRSVTAGALERPRGPGCRSHLLRQAREALGLRHRRTPPCTPKTIDRRAGAPIPQRPARQASRRGKAERCIKTMLADRACAVPCRAFATRRREPPGWPHRDHHLRPPQGIGGSPPITRLAPRLNNRLGAHG
jgi:hypothetical protein